MPQKSDRVFIKDVMQTNKTIKKKKGLEDLNTKYTRQIKDFDLKDFKDKALKDKANLVAKLRINAAWLNPHSCSSLSSECCLLMANPAFVLVPHAGKIKCCVVLMWRAHAA